MHSILLLLSIHTIETLSTPVDYPIKVDLPVYEDPEAFKGPSDVHLAEPLLPENHPGVDTLHNNKPNLVDHKLGAANDILHYKTQLGYGTKTEGALLETEGFGSKVLSVNEGIQHVAAGILQPKPIVDTIREEEKYGNTGDKFYSTGRAIVGGAERISNLVNSLIAIPGTLLNTITRSASEKLNTFGGKLVGL